MPSESAAPVVSDDELMRRMNTGSIEALGVLYERYLERALGIARSICRDRGSAEEAVQEGFEAVWKSRGTYCCDRGTVVAWAMGIVRHRALDAARPRAPTVVGESGHPPPEPASAADQLLSDFVAEQESERLRQVLARVPAPQREVIALAFYGQLSHSEIAARLGLPTGTVKGRMRLGLEKLRKELSAPRSGTSG